jgi:hypothetical protein
VTDTDGSDHLRTAYDQLCTSYHAIDDFRAKLLGFLPLVTGGGLILLTGPADDVREEFFAPVGLFGIAVTAGLLAYEIFGIKKCHALLSAGEDLERRMGLSDAQFKRRPNNVLGVINEPFAAALIYPAVLAAWTYLALFVSHRALGNFLSPIVFFVGLVGILLYDQSLRNEPKEGQLTERLEREVPRLTRALAAIQVAARQARDDARQARALAVAGIAVGVLDLLAGGLGVRRRRA